jgi:orotate phosphoribosyltransferase
MTSEEVLNVFRNTGALLEGHFVLRSGLHSRQFFQCALALQHMPTVEKLGAALANKIKPSKPATILSPAMGGLVLGQEVARQLGVRFIFAEKEDGKLVLRRGFKLAEDEPVAIVEDVVTKGGRVQETLEIARNLGARVVAIGMAVDRSGGKINFDGVPAHSLISLEVETFEAGNLPADLARIPAVKPGSK